MSPRRQVEVGAMATGGVTSSLLSEVGKNMVLDVQSSEFHFNKEHLKSVALESLWADSDVVILFMRRFGCQLGRLGAVKLSLIQVFV